MFGEGCVICNCRQHKYPSWLSGGAACFRRQKIFSSSPLARAGFKPVGHRTVEQSVDVTLHMFGRSVDAVQFAVCLSEAPLGTYHQGARCGIPEMEAQRECPKVVELSERVPNFVESGLRPGNVPFEMELFTMRHCSADSAILE